MPNATKLVAMSVVLAVRLALASDLPSTTPEAEGFSSRKLAQATDALVRSNLPIYSIVLSRHGRIVYEFYSGGIDRNDAHYVMSVTKTVTALLIGLAIDRGLIRSDEQSVVELIAPDLFPTTADRARFAPLTLRNVLGMSALDAPVAPHDNSPEAKARSAGFFASSNRPRFVLGQRLLPTLGTTFQYTDLVPTIAIAALQSVAHKRAHDFAEDTLFGPLGFRNVEWMHADASGFDNGAYGLRLRPIDMQKLGVLLLGHGVYQGRRVVSASWIDRLLAPWIRSSPERATPNYGYYTWHADYGGGWVAAEANGWKGQRIAVFPTEGVVVTMTACLEDGSEERVFSSIIHGLVAAALISPRAPLPDDRIGTAELAAALDRAHEASRLSPFAEWRMIPSATPKERPATPTR